MNFRNARARQPEILRSVQKDANYSNELTGNLLDILQLTGARNWIKYHELCQLAAQIAYHGFAAWNHLQTLGEEYTGIIQLDENYRDVPGRILQLTAIVLEFGGVALFLQVLKKVENYIQTNDEVVPEAKQKLLQLVRIMRSSPSYLQALHKSLFYLRSNKYQISKRIIGINYVLIRHWLSPDLALYGYKLLGIVTLLQVLFSVGINSLDFWQHQQQTKLKPTEQHSLHIVRDDSDVSKHSTAHCILCLEPRSNSSLTPCGHLFCWQCILAWLDERNECPVCREHLKKSQVIQLQNYK